MANILILNADSNLKRLIKLALPGMEHFVRHSATLRTANVESATAKLDLVVARLVADDDQGPEDLVDLRKNFSHRSADCYGCPAQSCPGREKVPTRRARASH